MSWRNYTVIAAQYAYNRYMGIFQPIRVEDGTPEIDHSGYFKYLACFGAFDGIRQFGKPGQVCIATVSCLQSNNTTCRITGKNNFIGIYMVFLIMLFEILYSGFSILYGEITGF